MPLILQNLGSNIVGGSTNSFLLLSLVLQPGGQPEVPQLNLHILIEEQVAKLKISMDNFILVQIFQGGNNLCKVVLSLHLG